MTAFAAYQQLRPVEDSTANDVKFWAQEDFARKQEDRIAASQKERLKLDKEKDRSARLDKYSKFTKTYDTGSQSMNEMVGAISSSIIV